jgi:hypothetical protein
VSSSDRTQQLACVTTEFCALIHGVASSRIHRQSDSKLGVPR